MRARRGLPVLLCLLAGCVLGVRPEPEEDPGPGLVLFPAASAVAGLRATEICEFADAGPPPRAVPFTSDTIRHAVAVTKPSVVNVYVRSAIPVRVNVLSMPVPGLPAVHLEGEALGSGFICSPRGFVLTNAHVVRRAAELAAKTSDGRLHALEIVAVDRGSDLALLHAVGAGPFPSSRLAAADRLEEGDWVIAIGNPLGLTHTVSHGIVSQKSRVFGAARADGLSFIQSDTPINPGNSGGPLVDLDGHVVGINAAIVQGAQGISFTIPTERVRAFLEELHDRANGGAPAPRERP